MPKYLDFENEKYEKGFTRFLLNTETIKANIGKRICYVSSRDIDPHRGYFTVRHAVIFGKRYNQLIINEYGDTVDIRDIVECGIKIETPTE